MMYRSKLYSSFNNRFLNFSFISNGNRPCKFTQLRTAPVGVYTMRFEPVSVLIPHKTVLLNLFLLASARDTLHMENQAPGRGSIELLYRAWSGDQNIVVKVRVGISQTDRTSSSADISIESVTQPTYQANCREVCRRDSSQLKYVSNKLLDMDIHNWQYDCSSQNPFSNASLNKVITLRIQVQDLTVASFMCHGFVNLAIFHRHLFTLL